MFTVCCSLFLFLLLLLLLLLSPQIIKFVGCYHGHADSFLVKAGSGVATLGLPDSPGEYGVTNPWLTNPLSVRCRGP
jgi:hypothetical protein